MSSTGWLIRCAAIVPFLLIATSCGSDTPSAGSTANTKAPAGMSAISDDVSQKNIVQVALASKDHTTLVAALQAADLVDVLANPGPFTVFAPTNAAFEKLPAGVVEGLLKADKKNDLRNILQYHVTVSMFKAESFKNDQSLWMVNGNHTKFTVKDGKVGINDAHILASVQCSNGIVHVIDAVLLPPEKK